MFTISASKRQRSTVARFVGAALAISASSLTAAPLPDGTVLSVDRGVGTCVISGTFPNCSYNAVIPTSGSYFDMAGKGITFIEGYNGLVIGSAQPATGSHTGAPNGSESPSVDDPWTFFTNTGMHFTVGSGITDPDDGTLNFSNWRVTWNGIPAINMGTGAHSGGTNGRAAITCTPTPCANGSTYTLTYYATVPAGDPSGFGGVQYTLHLEGTVSVPGSITTDGGAVNPGTIGSGAGTIRVSALDLSNAGVPEDTEFSNFGGYFDFVVTGVVGGVANVVIPLTSNIPANAVYRKYINGNWTTFTSDGVNAIASAASVAGNCPAVGNAAYNHANGLVAGDDCLQLTIQDDGAYDADTTNATTVEDPGGIATAAATVTPTEDTRTSGSSGCTISTAPRSIGSGGDWLLVGALLAGLGIRRKLFM